MELNPKQIYKKYFSTLILLGLQLSGWYPELVGGILK